MNRAMLLSAILSVHFTSGAVAQTTLFPVERPNRQVGEIWRESRGDGFKETQRNRVVVEKITESEVLYQVTDELTGVTKPEVSTLEGNLVERDGRFVPYYGALSFPLAPGKKWNHKSEYRHAPSMIDFKFDISGEVVGEGQVKVAAGTFMAVRVLLRIREIRSEPAGWSSGVLSSEQRVEFWYAPAAKRIVRWAREIHFPGLAIGIYRDTRELLSYELK